MSNPTRNGDLIWGDVLNSSYELLVIRLTWTRTKLDYRAHLACFRQPLNFDEVEYLDIEHNPRPGMSNLKPLSEMLQRDYDTSAPIERPLEKYMLAVRKPKHD